jgi:hypothetical protein
VDLLDSRADTQVFEVPFGSAPDVDRLVYVKLFLRQGKFFWSVNVDEADSEPGQMTSEHWFEARPDEDCFFAVHNEKTKLIGSMQFDIEFDSGIPAASSVLGLQSDPMRALMSQTVANEVVRRFRDRALEEARYRQDMRRVPEDISEKPIELYVAVPDDEWELLTEGAIPFARSAARAMDSEYLNDTMKLGGHANLDAAWRRGKYCPPHFELILDSLV